MPFERISDVGPLEFLLLGVLWELNEAAARDVLQAYNGKHKRPLAYTTVATLLARMEEKGILIAEKSRQPYLYKPLVTRDQLLRQRIMDFVQTFFPGRPMDLALHLVEQHPLSEESLEQLESILKRHKSSRKKKAR